MALKIFLEAESMKEGSLEGIKANSGKIVEKMEKVRLVLDLACLVRIWTE